MEKLESCEWKKGKRNHIICEKTKTNKFAIVGQLNVECGISKFYKYIYVYAESIAFLEEMMLSLVSFSYC